MYLIGRSIGTNIQEYIKYMKLKYLISWKVNILIHLRDKEPILCDLHFQQQIIRFPYEEDERI